MSEVQLEVKEPTVTIPISMLALAQGAFIDVERCLLYNVGGGFGGREEYVCPDCKRESGEAHDTDCNIGIIKNLLFNELITKQQEAITKPKETNGT